jgi:hypothetical protein
LDLKYFLYIPGLPTGVLVRFFAEISPSVQFKVKKYLKKKKKFNEDP